MPERRLVHPILDVDGRLRSMSGAAAGELPRGTSNGEMEGTLTF